MTKSRDQTARQQIVEALLSSPKPQAPTGKLFKLGADFIAGSAGERFLKEKIQQQQVIATPSDFGVLLKATRKAQGLTQQQFADLSGVGRRFIIECEAGKPRLEFAKVLQVAASAGIDIIAKKR